MKLYHMELQQVQDLELIETSEGLMYVSFISEEDLLKNGYKKVIEGAMPEHTEPDKKLVMKTEETSTSYKIFYAFEELSSEEKAEQALVELQEQIEEIEGYIRHAILIGNENVLPELREEYKTLLVQKQALDKEE